DGWPDIVNDAHRGYWEFDEVTGSLVWRANRFPEGTANPTGNHKVVLDYNLDGYMDLLVGVGRYSENADFLFKLYRNNGDGTFSDATDSSLLSSFRFANLGYWTTYANSVVADLNLDGYPD